MKKLKLILASIFFVFIGACDKEEDNEPSVEGCTNLPYCHYMQLDYGSYVEIPHDPDLSPAGTITLEGWARLDTDSGTNIFFHKRLYTEQEGYIVSLEDVEGQRLFSSYLGNNPREHAGKIPIQEWVHWAVTSDGTHRRHYINGELVGEFNENASPFTPSNEPLLLAKEMSANSGLAEFRLWKVARTQEQLQTTMNTNIVSPMPGLIAVWPLAENADDIIGNHNGILHNNPMFKEWCCPE